MVRLQVVEQNGRIAAFTVSGHAGYAHAGSDIVCAAVSALVYTAVNSCEKLLHVELPTADDGRTLRCTVPESLDTDSVQLLLRSMVFGVEQAAEQYPQYAKVSYQQ